MLRRIALKPPDEETGSWFYEGSLPDREAFLTQLFGLFANLPAEIEINTTSVGPEEVFAQAVEALREWGIPQQSSAWLRGQT